MSNYKTIDLAELLGWADGELYTYEGKFYALHENTLYVDSSKNGWQKSNLSINLIEDLANGATKKTYYLAHKFFEEDQNYLNLNLKTNLFSIGDCLPLVEYYQTQFTSSEIFNMELSGFSLSNFRMVPVQ